MQFKYIAAAISSLLISGIMAAPMPNPEALESTEGNELVARSEQAKQAKQIGPAGFDQFNGPGTSLMSLGNNGLGGDNYIDPSLLYGGGGGGGGGNRFNPVSLYGGGGGLPCSQCGGEQTGFCQWGQPGQRCTQGGGNTYQNTEYSKDQRFAASNNERYSSTNLDQNPDNGWGNGGLGFGFKA